MNDRENLMSPPVPWYDEVGPKSPLGNFNVTPIRSHTDFMKKQFMRTQFSLPKEALFTWKE